MRRPLPGAPRRDAPAAGRTLATAALLASIFLIPGPAWSADDPAGELLRSLDPELAVVAGDALDRAPTLAVARAELDVLGHGPELARALPDPMVSATLFALPPETRVGPQRLSIGARQRVPWPERRRLAGRRAELATERAAAELVRHRLGVLLRVRELWIEIAFLDEQAAILDDQRRHLELHEEAARARYAAGTGPASGPVRLQAETTRLATRRAGVDDRRAVLVAELAALRDRSALDPASSTIQPRLPDPPPEALDAILPTSIDDLVEHALDRRPEMARVELERQSAAVGVAVAELADKPDFDLGVAWTMVERRDDSAGRANPPEGDGDDILALTAGVNVPIDRSRRRAELAAATARETAIGSRAHAVAVELRRRVEALSARAPIEARQLGLLRDVLRIQADEAVDAATAGYRAGSLQVLDLLDAEHRLYEVRLAIARARADLALTLARLEDATATPLDAPTSDTTSEEPADD